MPNPQPYAPTTLCFAELRYALLHRPTTLPYLRIIALSFETSSPSLPRRCLPASLHLHRPRPCRVSRRMLSHDGDPSVPNPTRICWMLDHASRRLAAEIHKVWFRKQRRTMQRVGDSGRLPRSFGARFTRDNLWPKPARSQIRHHADGRLHGAGWQSFVHQEFSKG